jgi:hypothetical protein
MPAVIPLQIICGVHASVRLPDDLSQVSRGWLQLLSQFHVKTTTGFERRRCSYFSSWHTTNQRIAGDGLFMRIAFSSNHFQSFRIACNSAASLAR